MGYRGGEISLPKPEGCFRIVVLGGSTTYGEFINDDRQTFPARLEERLRDIGYPRVEVINAGVPGYNSWESLSDLQFHALDFEPDLVIPYYGINDVHCRLVVPQSYRSDNSGRRVLWTEPLRATLCRHSVLFRIVGYHLGICVIEALMLMFRRRRLIPGHMDHLAPWVRISWPFWTRILPPTSSGI